MGPDLNEVGVIRPMLFGERPLAEPEIAEFLRPEFAPTLALRAEALASSTISSDSALWISSVSVDAFKSRRISGFCCFQSSASLLLGCSDPLPGIVQPPGRWPSARSGTPAPGRGLVRRASSSFAFNSDVARSE